MPEGPEIHRAARQVGRALEGRIARSVWFAFADLANRARTLEGREVRAVEPRGKAMLIRFDGGHNIYSHNQLYGKWYVRKGSSEPKTNRSLRVAIRNDDYSALLYSASDVAVLRDQELATHPFLARIGPDVLDPEVTAGEVRARLEGRAFRRRSLGALLLDQRFLCGLGNYLRSEVLHVAGLHPAQRPQDLNDRQLDELAECTLTISRRALRTGGITNASDSVRELRSEGVPRSELRHFVFARAGKRCRQCGETVQRIETAGRRLYLCPVCQPV